MKRLNIALSDDVYEQLSGTAEAMEKSVTEVIRNSLELYMIMSSYSREGRTLFYKKGKDTVEVLIPGLSK